jgi:hypothetical protein
LEAQDYTVKETSRLALDIEEIAERIERALDAYKLADKNSAGGHE